MFDSVPIMRCLFMLQILIAVTQPNLEARQRLFNVKGVYTLQEHIHNHEIVIPRKVNHRGDFISENVTHHHHKDGPVVHYRMAVAGNEYHLELTAVDNFIGRAMVVERRKRDLHVRSPAKSHSSKCHYRGFIKGHRNSRVALSACDGLIYDGAPSRCPRTRIWMRKCITSRTNTYAHLQSKVMPTSALGVPSTEHRGPIGGTAFMDAWFSCNTV
ncbi:ATS16 metalloproteinase, partial [Acromyrmex insinuator]